MTARLLTNLLGALIAIAAIPQVEAAAAEIDAVLVGVGVDSVGQRIALLDRAGLQQMHHHR